MVLVRLVELHSSPQKLVMDPLLYVFRMTNGVWRVVRCRITSLFLLTARHIFSLWVLLAAGDDVCSPSSVSDSRLSSSSRRLFRRGVQIKGVSSSLEPCHDDKVENPPRCCSHTHTVLLLEAFWQRGSVKCPLQVPPCLMSLSDSFFANLKVVRDGGAVAHCFGHPVPVDWVHGALCYSCSR